MTSPAGRKLWILRFQGTGYKSMESVNQTKEKEKPEIILDIIHESNKVSISDDCDDEKNIH